MGAVLGAIDDAVLEALGFDENFTFIPPFGPDGVATLVLDIEIGFRVTHKWSTDVQPMSSGKERRHCTLDAPQQFFSGTAFLEGNLPRQVKSILARYAAAGSVFLLGLAHEALTLSADAAGNTVFLDAANLAKCDWKNRGQRVALAQRDPDTNQLVFRTGVIQDFDANSIELDVSAGIYGDEGGLIMPLFPIFPEPQQDFERFKTNVEKWKLNARSAIFDFAPTLASVAIIEDEVPTGAIAYVRYFGAYGNKQYFERIDADGYPDDGELVETVAHTRFNQKPGTTTLGDLATALEGSSNFVLRGDFDPDATVQWEQGGFATGGASSGPVGTGAALTTYNGDGTVRPVWDRELENPTTVTDAVQANTRIIDHGATPYSLAKVDKPTNGRNILYIGDDHADWQWWKLFTSTVRGRQKAFWLATWASDLNFVGKAVGTITVRSDDESDFFGWWPKKRQYIQVVENNGTTTYAKITDAVDNGDDTVTLTIGVTLGSESVAQISWLELVRFSSDDHEVTFGIKSGLFSFPSHATEVQE
jgi:hypothetical protein